MNKNRILNGFEEKYGRPMTKKEKSLINKKGIKPRPVKKKSLQSPLKKAEQRIYGKGVHSSYLSPLQLMQIYLNHAH